MASNSFSESKNADAVLLGLGLFGLAPYPFTSAGAIVDVGYIKGCSVSVSRELKDFESGGVLVKRLIFRDSMSFKVDWAEVSVTNMNKVIGGNKAGNVLTFGGGRAITRYYARFEHTMDTDEILQFDMYKSTPSGSFELAFAEEDFVTYPVEFGAELDSTKTAGQQYGSITLVTP